MLFRLLCLSVQFFSLWLLCILIIKVEYTMLNYWLDFDLIYSILFVEINNAEQFNNKCVTTSSMRSAYIYFLIFKFVLSLKLFLFIFHWIAICLHRVNCYKTDFSDCKFSFDCKG